MRATVAKRLRRVARITCDTRIPTRQLVRKGKTIKTGYNTAILETGCYRQVYQQLKKQHMGAR